MSNSKTDLHIHTIHSDGAATVPELLAHVSAGNVVGTVGPDQPGEFFTPVGGAGVEDEIGKKRLSRTCGDDDAFALGNDVELSEQPNLKHGDLLA